ncbi:hypothetical protein DFJ74DRAFT_764495 [Hyaloraphidium curvatum]|nr:hypothetical protein DFJ74DRAFT_764495 [Hyaloraphidium curvatum]
MARAGRRRHGGGRARWPAAALLAAAHLLVLAAALLPPVAASPAAFHFNASLVARGITGADDRRAVGAPAAFPFRTLARLEIRGRFGQHSCSGALIAPLFVLTAASCLFRPADAPRGRPAHWVDAVAVTVGRHGARLPYGRVAARELHVPPEFRTAAAGGYTAQAARFDWAVVKLARTVPAGSMGRWPAPFSGPVTVAGYPSSRGGGTTPHLASCAFRSSPQPAIVSCDGSEGQSGAPAFRGTGVGASIVGVWGHEPMPGGRIVSPGLRGEAFIRRAMGLAGDPCARCAPQAVCQGDGTARRCVCGFGFAGSGASCARTAVKVATTRDPGAVKGVPTTTRRAVPTLVPEATTTTVHVVPTTARVITTAPPAPLPPPSPPPPPPPPPPTTTTWTTTTNTLTTSTASKSPTSSTSSRTATTSETPSTSSLTATTSETLSTSLTKTPTTSLTTSTRTPGATLQIRTLTGGTSHFLALLENGTLLAWDASGNPRADISPSGPADEVAAGDAHTVVLQRDGTARLFGFPDNGPIYDGAPDVAHVGAGVWQTAFAYQSGAVYAYDYSQRPAPIRPPARVVRMGAQWGATYYLLANGTLCINRYCDLMGNDVLDMAVGWWAALATTGSGRLMYFFEDITIFRDFPASSEGIVGLAAGERFALALAANGTVFRFGSVVLPDVLNQGVVSIGAARGYGMAQLGSGRVVVWDRFTGALMPVPAELVGP